MSTKRRRVWDVTDHVLSAASRNQNSSHKTSDPPATKSGSTSNGSGAASNGIVNNNTSNPNAFSIGLNPMGSPHIPRQNQNTHPNISPSIPSTSNTQPQPIPQHRPSDPLSFSPSVLASAPLQPNTADIDFLRNFSTSFPPNPNHAGPSTFPMPSSVPIRPTHTFTQASLPTSSTNIFGNAAVDPTDEQSHGTLVISHTGRSKYLGPTAASEWLKDVSVGCMNRLFP